MIHFFQDYICIQLFILVYIYLFALCILAFLMYLFYTECMFSLHSYIPVKLIKNV